MSRYEYKMVPAPRKAARAKGVRGTEARFAHGLTDLVNAEAQDGWEFQGAESLPCEERSGFFGSVTVFRNLLVFRRWIEDEVVDPPLRSLYNRIEPEPGPATPEELAAELAAGRSATHGAPADHGTGAGAGQTPASSGAAAGGPGAGPRLGAAGRGAPGTQNTPALGAASRGGEEGVVHRLRGADGREAE